MGLPRRVTIRRRSQTLLVALLGALTLGASVGRANDGRADWTVIVVLSGAYVDSLGRFEAVGSSDRVNVVVLHDTGDLTSAYRMLPDTDASHLPGECCPSGGTCCGREMLALADLGLSDASRVSEETLDKYFSYVQLHFPARHYLLTMRGHASESSLSVNWGGGRVTVPQLATLLDHFSARRGGKKLEVLNLGMCQTASTDWVYELAPSVKTFVGSANYTNPPVAMRWRMHLWVRELLRESNALRPRARHEDGSALRQYVGLLRYRRAPVQQCVSWRAVDGGGGGSLGHRGSHRGGAGARLRGVVAR